MFSLLTVLLAAAVGFTAGAVLVWVVIKEYRVAFLTMLGTLPALVVLAIRIVGEWK